MLARALAQKLTDAWGQQVIVENRPAGAGHVGMDYVAKSAPDGYTLVVAADASFVVNPHLYTKLTYDPIHDFVPVTGLGISPQGLLLHPSVPANSLAELIELGKKKPGELNYGTFGVGTSGHLNIVSLEKLTGARFTPVHYRGAAPAITDLLGGHIQMMIVAIGLVQQNLQAGKIKVLGVRFKRAPAAISGCSGHRRNATGLHGGLVVRPRRAERHAARDRRQAQLRDAENLRRSGVPRPIPGARRDASRSPARRTNSPSAMDADLARWGKIIKDANIKVE